MVRRLALGGRFSYFLSVSLVAFAVMRYWLVCGSIWICRTCVEKEPICFSESNLCFCWLDTPISLYSVELLVFSVKSCWRTISTICVAGGNDLKKVQFQWAFLCLCLNIHTSPFPTAFLCTFLPKWTGSWFYIFFIVAMCCSSNNAMLVIAHDSYWNYWIFAKMTTDNGWLDKCKLILCMHYCSKD